MAVAAGTPDAHMHAVFRSLRSSDAVAPDAGALFLDIAGKADVARSVFDGDVATTADSAYVGFEASLRLDVTCQTGNAACYTVRIPSRRPSCHAATPGPQQHACRTSTRHAAHLSRARLVQWPPLPSV